MNEQIVHWTGEIVVFTSWICAVFFFVGFGLLVATKFAWGAYEYWVTVKLVREAINEKKAREHEDQE